MKIGQIIALIILGPIASAAIGYAVYRATGGLGDFAVWIKGKTLFGSPYDAMAWIVEGIIAGWAIGYLRSKSRHTKRRDPWQF